MNKNLIAAIFAAAMLFPAMASASFSLFGAQKVVADTNFSEDLRGSNAYKGLSAQLNSSAGAPAAKTFDSGTISTGNITINSNDELAYAPSTFSIVVNSTQSLYHAVLTLNGVAYTEGTDWFRAPTTAATASNIAALFNRKLLGFVSTATNSTVYSTAAVPGTAYNSITISTGTNAGGALTPSGTSTSGGVNGLTITVNGIKFTAGREFAVGNTAADTASNLATAINDHASLPDMEAEAIGAVVFSSATVVGSDGQLTITASNSKATVSNITTAVDGDFALDSANIHIVGHSWPSGLSVYYSTSNDLVPISGLSHGATYYVVKVDDDNIKLSDSEAHAVAGTNTISLGTQVSSTTAVSYTLTPSPFAAGSVAAKWQVSNDNVNWVDIASGDTDFDSGAFSSGSEAWDFGAVNYRYIRLKFTGPTTGFVNLEAILNMP